jgi:hypothetical protein
LLNLTGFFSSVGGPFLAILGTPVAGVELILWDSLAENMGPDQGKRLLRRKARSRECVGKKRKGIHKKTV